MDVNVQVSLRGRVTLFHRLQYADKNPNVRLPILLKSSGKEGNSKACVVFVFFHSNRNERKILYHFSNTMLVPIRFSALFDRFERKSVQFQPSFFVQMVNARLVYFSVTNQTTHTEDLFLVMLFVMVYRMVLSFESVDEVRKCDHSNKSYRGGNSLHFCLLCCTAWFYF